MTSRPILFSAPMIRALLAGRKTQTRRAVKPRHDWHVDQVPDRRGVWRDWPVFESYVYSVPETVEVPCPYGQPGDELWVRETIKRVPANSAMWDAAIYAADDAPTSLDTWTWERGVLPAIHCPRGLSRITLRVTSVRCERLQAISEDDAMAEGIEQPQRDPTATYIDEFWSARRAYRKLWESLNGAGSWAANPWVWVVGFERMGATP